MIALVRSLIGRPQSGGRFTVNNGIPTFLTCADVAKMLRRKAETIQQYAREGKLVGRKIGRSWLFTHDDVQRFVRSQH